MFVENSKAFTNGTAGKSLRKRLLRLGKDDKLCSICGLYAEWNNKPIKMQLDHINGIHSDNRFDNLRFVCPNCHTQTDTFSGRNNKKENNETNNGITETISE
jgi:5-methylcytosine-specific restriction endonuclease McrA